MLGSEADWGELEGADDGGQHPDRQEDDGCGLDEPDDVKGAGLSIHDDSFRRRWWVKGFIGCGSLEAKGLRAAFVGSFRGPALTTLPGKHADASHQSGPDE